MYHPSVVQTRIDTIQRKTGLTLNRYEVPEVADRCAELDKCYDKDKEEWVRRPQKEQTEFIRNESIVCVCDFRYWAERYAHMKLDGGGLGRFVPWQSQQIVMDRYIAPLDAEMHQRSRRQESTEGIRLILHKARQLGMTAFARILTVHRMIFGKYLNAIGASVDDDMVKELYDRDKLIYDHLPFWMRPSIKFEEKAAHVHFAQDTKIIYQQSNQISGLGQGRQFEISHLTECASWKYPLIIENDFFPTIPLSTNTLAILESTAQGRGNWWHEFTEGTRTGEHPEWTYVFIPWYACWKDIGHGHKYAMTAPLAWVPQSVTLQHAKKVQDTSSQWTGSTTQLTRDQLYWYELRRESARKAGTLNIFLTNYCATPEESFQHSTSSAFSSELLERIRMGTSAPETIYEMEHAR